ncbi:hypothetical protein M8494_08875 [Serratia ureilytica]
MPGVALTPEQIAALQQDIVWLVSETVQTEGGPQTVWVPKVYRTDYAAPDRRWRANWRRRPATLGKQHHQCRQPVCRKSPDG